MKKVLIIFGGNSSEHYVSCKSAKSIIKNIDRRFFSYEVVGIDFDNNWYKFNDNLKYLEKGNWKEANILKIDNIVDYIKEFDVVFPITHGTNGEDGKLQGMLELFDIPFVGCNTISSAIGMDKAISKLILEKLDIPVVPYIIIKDNYNVEDILNQFSLPLIVKPANGGSSIGISMVSKKGELIKAIKEAKKYDDKIIIEKFIKVRELEVAILEDKNNLICSNPGEINSANEFYDYDAKYVNDNSYTLLPSDIPSEVIDRIKGYACRLFHTISCSNYARVDFFYDDDTKDVFLNEINTIPGFTTISMFPKLMENEKISYTDLITILINNAQIKKKGL